MNQDQIAQLVGVVAQTVQQAAAPASPGWKTSEFWLHIVSLVPTVLAVSLGAANPISLGAGAVCVLGSAVYSACRSHVKASGVAIAAQAAQAAAAAIQQAAQAPAA